MKKPNMTWLLCLMPPWPALFAQALIKKNASVTSHSGAILQAFRSYFLSVINAAWQQAIGYSIESIAIYRNITNFLGLYRLTS